MQRRSRRGRRGRASGPARARGGDAVRRPGEAARILVLTWNLFHGRAVPAAGRPLLVEFCRALAGWEWDVALLQEVPPWWPDRLAAASGATARSTLTARNSLPALRRAIAARNPDLLAAAGGGANAILVRGPAIAGQRTRELTRRPERRVMHGVALSGHGWVVNLHASTHPPEQRSADLLTAVQTARAWAGGQPLVFGGDLNVTRPELEGLRHVAGHHVDHLLTNGRPATGAAEPLDAAPLSDHRPLRVAVEPLPDPTRAGH